MPSKYQKHPLIKIKLNTFLFKVFALNNLQLVNDNLQSSSDNKASHVGEYYFSYAVFAQKLH